MRGLFLNLAVVTFVINLSAPVQAQDVTVEERADVTPTQYEERIPQGKHGGVDGFDVTHYEVLLIPNVENKSVSGTEEIKLVVGDKSLASIEFSPNSLVLNDAKLNGQPVAFASDERAISFTPKAPVPAGSKVTITFAFTGTPKRGITAVPGGMYSSYFACDWMVCRQDTSGDKAMLRLGINTPKGLRTLGPGKMVLAQDLVRTHNRYWWETSFPYSSYLYGFAVGPFRKTEAKSSAGNIIYLDATGGEQDIRSKFLLTPGLMDFLADKAGLPLATGNYTQLLVPGHEAQEAATHSLIGIEALNRDLTEPDTAWILAHEGAHQYWGNLITCASWRDFWLNEGLATFMTAAWLETRHGFPAYEAEMNRARKRLTSAQELGFNKPLRWNGKYISLGVRRAVQYSKGALFLDHLRMKMGDEAFWQGIKAYTRTHAGGTVTSMDFERAMQAATKTNLGPDFKEWVYGDNIPE